jgi:hypothetical protein
VPLRFRHEISVRSSEEPPGRSREAAADAGLAHSAHNAALLYEDLGDHRSALRWRRRAAAMGDEHAIRELSP